MTGPQWDAFGEKLGVLVLLLIMGVFMLIAAGCAAQLPVRVYSGAPAILHCRKVAGHVVCR